MKSQNKWLIANAVGAIVYLFVASNLWVRPEDQGQPGGFGDGFYWFIAVVPIELIFLIINFVAVAVFVAKYRVSKNPTPLLLWAIVMLAWGNVLLFDHMKAVRYIDSKYAQQGVQADSFAAA